ncbi:chorismate mutase [Photorhabdus temperata]|uniref:chorismate mutase n=1 Tax=Photorhabdus temperata subsp. temperata Meg1 TaxID=1393735 RepID=A0A081S299_PHOTE|nr:chorismate mutase [Photorhabdus temperata]KER05052.1 chorismate mutase [Photorhabdus temperata subsp. temperata Meg1]MCT8347485.1 chorismate mutase [Photorhabdus temperata]
MQRTTRRGAQPVSRLRAIRGAVQVAADTPELIAKGTVEMVSQVIASNDLHHTDLISIFFTVTPDLTSELPPLAVQEAGWVQIPMLCAAELHSQRMIPRVIRMLAHVHWRKQRSEPSNVYLPGTTPARPV